MTTGWKDVAIRVTLVAVGACLLFYPPAFLAGHLLPKIGGALASLAGILGAERMGHLNTFVLLTLVYFLTVGPLRVFTWIRRDHPLEAPRGDSRWRPRPAPNPEIDPRRRIRFQF